MYRFRPIISAEISVYSYRNFPPIGLFRYFGRNSHFRPKQRLSAETETFGQFSAILGNSRPPGAPATLPFVLFLLLVFAFLISNKFMLAIGITTTNQTDLKSESELNRLKLPVTCHGSCDRNHRRLASGTTVLPPVEIIVVSVIIGI